LDKVLAALPQVVCLVGFLPEQARGTPFHPDLVKGLPGPALRVDDQLGRGPRAGHPCLAFDSLELSRQLLAEDRELAEVEKLADLLAISPTRRILV
jgi:hypothetical protein